MEQQTREQKLEAAFTQFIESVAEMRHRQKLFDTHFGADNRKAKHRKQKEVDKILQQMGITDNMDFKDCSISFVK